MDRWLFVDQAAVQIMAAMVGGGTVAGASAHLVEPERVAARAYECANALWGVRAELRAKYDEEHVARVGKQQHKFEPAQGSGDCLACGHGREAHEC